MNKFLVLTGGTKGIGRAILEKFVQQGFDVATCARHAADLSALADDLRRINPATQVHTFRADMSQAADVKAFCQSVVALQRPVDVLVNNAGYFAPGDICTEPDGNLENMMNANLYSAYHTTRGLVASMRTRREGHIFNICSIASIQAYANGGSYAITKFAMLGMTKCLREELKGDGIRVTAVLPGATLTASWAGVELPPERFMKPEDVADAVFGVYALSPQTVVEELLLRPQLGDI